MMISYEIGCRYFELSHPFDIAEKGHCILSDYTFEKSDDDKNTIDSIDSLGDFQLDKCDLNIIDLNDKIYEEDLSQIKENCKCFTCENNYTRAYIHHLLKCNEINATILIIM